MAGRYDVLISSSVHLATGWYGNTFSMSKPFSGRFHTDGGVDREVVMIKSELSFYRHARTSTFEAAALPCNLGYMLVVLPAPGTQILEIERELARSPEVLDEALKKEAGDVTLPPFHTKVEWDLAPHLQQLGIRRVFSDLGGLVSVPHSHLTEVRQTIDILVNQWGIRADAGTVAGGIYGGMMGGPLQPFSMQLDRPFLYFIRERYTDALLFAGAVVDPSLN
jgi:serine protease inhibitor